MSFTFIPELVYIVKACNYNSVQVDFTILKRVTHETLMVVHLQLVLLRKAVIGIKPKTRKTRKNKTIIFIYQNTKEHISSACVSYICLILLA